MHSYWVPPYAYDIEMDKKKLKSNPDGTIHCADVSPLLGVGVCLSFLIGVPSQHVCTVSQI
jgi:hypothetical protein